MWGIAIAGLTLEAVFFEDVPAWLSLIFYLGLGWLGVLTSWHFRRTFGDPSIRYLWMGGFYYSLGGVLDYLHWPVLIPGVLEAHELFHVCVIAGAAYHWWFIYKWAHYPTRNHLSFEVSVFPGKKYVAKAVGENLTIEAHSSEELKQQIHARVNQIFNANMLPASIRLKYFEEEDL